MYSQIAALRKNCTVATFETIPLKLLNSTVKKNIDERDLFILILINNLHWKLDTFIAIDSCLLTVYSSDCRIFWRNSVYIIFHLNKNYLLRLESNLDTTCASPQFNTTKSQFKMCKEIWKTILWLGETCSALLERYWMPPFVVILRKTAQNGTHLS